MKGKVLGFNADKGVGHILSDDKRFPFVSEEWLSSEAPKSGQTVDFVVEGDDAKSIYLMHEEGRSEENTLHKSVDVIKRNPVERVRNLYIAHIVGLFIWPILLIALILSYVWKKDQQYGWHYEHQIRMVWTAVGGLVVGTLFTGMITKGNDAQLILWLPLMLFLAIYIIKGYIAGMRKLDGLTPEPQDKATGRSVADNYEQSDMRAFPMNVGIRGRVPIEIVHDKNNIEKEQSLEGVPSSPKNTHQISNENDGTINGLVDKKELDDTIAPQLNISNRSLVASIGAVVAVIWLVIILSAGGGNKIYAYQTYDKQKIISQMDDNKQVENTLELLSRKITVRQLMEKTIELHRDADRITKLMVNVSRHEVSEREWIQAVRGANQWIERMLKEIKGGYLDEKALTATREAINEGRISQEHVDNLLAAYFKWNLSFGLLTEEAHAALTRLKDMGFREISWIKAHPHQKQSTKFVYERLMIWAHQLNCNDICADNEYRIITKGLVEAWKVTTDVEGQ